MCPSARNMDRYGSDTCRPTQGAPRLPPRPVPIRNRTDSANGTLSPLAQFHSAAPRLKTEPAQARAQAGRVFSPKRSRLPLLLFLFRRGLFGLLRRFLFGGFFGRFFLGRFRRRLFRSGFFCRRFRGRPRRRGLFLFRLLFRNHQLFFLGLDDLFGVTGELVILQRRHLIVFFKMILIEIHAFLPWGVLCFAARGLGVAGRRSQLCLARSYRIQKVLSSICGKTVEKRVVTEAKPPHAEPATGALNPRNLLNSSRLLVFCHGRRRARLAVPRRVAFALAPRHLRRRQRDCLVVRRQLKMRGVIVLRAPSSDILILVGGCEQGLV